MKIALISGEGLLPIEIAKRLKSLNYSTLIFSLSGENEQIKPYAEKFISLRYPNLGRGVREI
ncbi:MAG: LpxI family protein, partial [Synergistaceae bacterium]|nr:LpxI family protein [Synergistaceae bacterium]